MYIKSAQLIHTPLDMHSYPGFQETAEATIHAGNIVYMYIQVNVKLGLKILCL